MGAQAPVAAPRRRHVRRVLRAHSSARRRDTSVHPFAARRLLRAAAPPRSRCLSFLPSAKRLQRLHRAAPERSLARQRPSGFRRPVVLSSLREAQRAASHHGNLRAAAVRAREVSRIAEACTRNAVPFGIGLRRRVVVRVVVIEKFLNLCKSQRDPIVVIPYGCRNAGRHDEEVLVAANLANEARVGFLHDRRLRYNHALNP